MIGMPSSRRRLAALTLVFGTGFAGAATAQSPAHAGERPSDPDRRVVAAADRAYAEAWLRGDADAVMRTLHDDAVIVPSGLDAIEGGDAIRRWWFPADSPPTVVHRYVLHQDGIGGSGTLAYVRGRFELAFTYDGTEHESTGTYLSILRPDGDGTWRIALRSWNDH